MGKTGSCRQAVGGVNGCSKGGYGVRNGGAVVWGFKQVTAGGGGYWGINANSPQMLPPPLSLSSSARPSLTVIELRDTDDPSLSAPPPPPAPGPPTSEHVLVTTKPRIRALRPHPAATSAVPTDTPLKTIRLDIW
jgi:hypothetical protein